MKKYFPYILLAGITILFFYKTFFSSLLPFPGDLLISEYQPWKSYSFLGYNPGSYPSKKQYFDSIRQIYPWRTFVNTQLKNRTVPLWNPHNFSGQPLLANVQSQVFYPLTIVYFIFSQPVAWSILVILQPFLSSIGMYLYLQSIHRSKISSFFAAITFGFSLYTTVFLEYNTIGHVIIWLPFILFCIEKINISRNFFYRLLLVLSIVSASFAGHIQIFGTIIFFSILYTLILKKSSKQLFELGFLFIISLCIASIQLIPTIELLQYSARGNHEYSDFIQRLLIQPQQLLTVLNPDLFGNPATGNYLLNDSYPGKALFFGSVSIIFMIAGMLYGKKEKYSKFFMWTCILLLIFTIRTFFTELIYKFPIPFISQSGPGNFLFLFSFCGSALAAYGIDLWIDKKISLKKETIIILLVTGYLWFSHLFHISIYNRSMLLLTTGISAMYTILIVALHYKPEKKYFGIIIFGVITTGQLFYSFQKFNPFVPKNLFFPETKIVQFLQNQQGLSRFYGYGAGEIEANFATEESLYDANGYDPLYPKMYGGLIASSTKGSIPTSFDTAIRSDAKIATGFGKSPFDQNIYRKKLLNLFGVRNIINKEENGTSEETFPPVQYPVIYKTDGFLIHENMSALPHAFFVSSYIVSDDASFDKKFYSPDFFPEKTAILDQSIPVSLPSNKSGIAQITIYSPNKVTLQTTTPSTQLLILSDTYMPGWKAYIDKKETTIYRTDYTLRGVVVPEGNHTIIFSYEPSSFNTGWKMTVVGLSVLLIYELWRKIKYRN